MKLHNLIAKRQALAERFAVARKRHARRRSVAADLRAATIEQLRAERDMRASIIGRARLWLFRQESRHV